MQKIINSDCLDYLDSMPKIKLIIADPPDNIGLSYNAYRDVKDREHYYLWLERILYEATFKCDVLWFSYNQIHDLKMCSILESLLRRFRASWSWRKILWHYTFGAYNDRDFTSCFRPMFCLCSPTAKLDVDSIREESVRQQIGDLRASGPKVPGDVWEYPRVVGNSLERQSWHPTQHPVSLYLRILKYALGRDEDFVDLFAGSGTCFRAAYLYQKLGWLGHCTGVEIDKKYCDKILETHTWVQNVDNVSDLRP